MQLLICTKAKNILKAAGVLLLALLAQPAWAAGPPKPSVFDNPLAVALLVLMALLLVVIALLAQLLLGTADLKIKKRKKEHSIPAGSVAASLLLVLLMSGTSLFAQDATSTVTTSAPATIAGMAASTFYIMISVIFLELLVIIALLINVRTLLKAEKAKLAPPVPVPETPEILEAKRNKLSWWDRFNSLRPASQEADLDLGHDYDGIRELNNRLPRWWVYGFYFTILFGAVYLWRYHVSHTAPLSEEEYKMSVAKAEEKIKAYLKTQGDNVDENTVKLLTDASDIAAGKAIFSNPSTCVPCHREDGGGNIGPNLTDDYWLYGGTVTDIFKTIKYGTTKGMRAWKEDLTPKQIAQLTSYLKTLHGTNPPNPKEPQGELFSEQTTKTAADSVNSTVDTLKHRENKMAVN